MLVVAVGPAGAPGDSVAVNRVTHLQGGLEVAVVVYRGCSLAAEQTMPFHVVRVPRSGGTVAFKDHVVIDPACIE
jgi:hypothetical protein